VAHLGEAGVGEDLALRVLRVDRIVTIEALPDTFTPPQELDALRTLEEHLSQGWTHPVDVLVDATIEETSRWVPRSLGRLEPDEESRLAPGLP
jgi:WYL domain